MDLNTLISATDYIHCCYDLEETRRLLFGEAVSVVDRTRMEEDGTRFWAAAVLSPGVYQGKDGSWQLTNLCQPTIKGTACGGTERIRAAFKLWKRFHGIVIPTSGRSHLDDGVTPEHWLIQSNELKSCGVPPSSISPEKASVDTISELAELLVLIAQRAPQLAHIYVVTNRYHVPRADLMLRLLAAYGHLVLPDEHQNMIERLLVRGDTYTSALPTILQYSDEMPAAKMLRKGITVSVVAAEGVCGYQDPVYRASEASIYRDHRFFRDQIWPAEMCGMDQLLGGTYGMSRK